MREPTAEALDESKLLLPLQENDHIQGPTDAKYTLVEYGDYECPACGALFLVLRRLEQQLRPNFCIVFRHFPVSGFHPHAQLAAEAAEAAGAQGKFWEMHDLLFEHQDALKEKDLVRYAEQLSLDVDRFRKELKARTYEKCVTEDFQRGVQNGVYTTPGLFINGIRHNKANDLETLLAEFEIPALQDE